MRAKRRTYAWERRTEITAITALVIAAVGVLIVLMVASGAPAFVFGMVTGGVVVGSVAATFWAVDHGAGSHNDKFGTYGEAATADLFASARARRAGWEIRHNLEFDGSDVDHVAFGPDGIFAVESKWSNVPWTVDGNRVVTSGRDPLDQARRNARHIRCLLRASGLRLPVVAVVVQWGPGGWSDEPWSVRWFGDDVLALRGRAGNSLLEEIDGISGVQLSTADLSRVRVALDARVNGRPSPVA